MKKKKEHKFIVTVKSFGNKRMARVNLQCSFASRNPDGCEFYISEYRKPKP